jgi:hypothetical protein
MSDDGAIAGPRPSRAGRVLAWLVVVLVVAALLAGTVISGRYEVAIAAVAGLLLAWLLVRLFRFSRQRPLAGVLLVVVILGVVGLSAAVVLFAGGRNTDPGAGAVDGSVTVRYHGEGVVDGNAIQLREELVLDDATLASMARTLGSAPAGGLGSDQIGLTGWSPTAPVDGFATYERNRTVAAGESSIVSSTVTIPMELGLVAVRMPSRSAELRLFPRDGSDMVIAAAKGAVGTTSPAAASVANSLRPGGDEVATINVDRNVDQVSVAVLAGPLRNPAGRAIYDAFVWGPLPWAIGAAFLLVASLLGDKLKKLLGWAAKRAIQGARPATPSQAEAT